jgi:hypothetical protein
LCAENYTCYASRVGTTRFIHAQHSQLLCFNSKIKTTRTISWSASSRQPSPGSPCKGNSRQKVPSFCTKPVLHKIFRSRYSLALQCAHSPLGGKMTRQSLRLQSLPRRYRKMEQSHRQIHDGQVFRDPLEDAYAVDFYYPLLQRS